MHFVFYGPEGSGKGTQAKLLADKLKLPIFTAGDLVREAAQKDTSEVGDMCRKVLSEGKYLPENYMNMLLAGKLVKDEAKSGFVLDGFPRTGSQARFLDETMRKAGYNLDKLIYLKLTDEESLQRLVKRKRVLFAGTKILHDDPKRITQRLSVYHKNEKEVLDFYRRSGLTLEVNAAQTVEKVFADILSGLHINS